MLILVDFGGVYCWCCGCRMDRVRLPSAEKWAAATKCLSKAQAEERRARQKAAASEGLPEAGPPKKKSKNVTTNELGDSIGRVYVENKPDMMRLKQIQSPLLHKLAREQARSKKQAKGPAGGGDAAGDAE